MALVAAGLSNNIPYARELIKRGAEEHYFFYGLAMNRGTDCINQKISPKKIHCIQSAVQGAIVSGNTYFVNTLLENDEIKSLLLARNSYIFSDLLITLGYHPLAETILRLQLYCQSENSHYNTNTPLYLSIFLMNHIT